jgi:hypothetical protein
MLAVAWPSCAWTALTLAPWAMSRLAQALLDESGPEELLRQVRAAEAVDPEGRQWPRTKRSDDATAVYLVLP